MIDEAKQKKKGSPSHYIFKENDGLFHICENYSLSCLERYLKIFTKEFVLEVSMEIRLSDTNKDTGSWEKDYYAIVQNDEHSGYGLSESISNDMIMNWFSKHAIDFI